MNTHRDTHRQTDRQTNRVRTIPVLGYYIHLYSPNTWLLGTGQYSQVLDSIVIGGYFLLFWHPIQYQSDSSQQHPHASEWLFSSTCDLYSDRRNRLSGHHAAMLLFIKQSLSSS